MKRKTLRGRGLPELDGDIAAAWAAIRLAIESFPALRPATTQSSLTRFCGGSRRSCGGVALFPREQLGQIARTGRLVLGGLRLQAGQDAPAFTAEPNNRIGIDVAASDDRGL